jgi:hypothetical protein
MSFLQMVDFKKFLLRAAGLVRKDVEETNGTERRTKTKNELGISKKGFLNK